MTLRPALPFRRWASDKNIPEPCHIFPPEKTTHTDKARHQQQSRTGHLPRQDHFHRNNTSTWHMESAIGDGGFNWLPVHTSLSTERVAVCGTCKRLRLPKKVSDSCHQRPGSSPLVNQKHFGQIPSSLPLAICTSWHTTKRRKRSST